MKERLQFASDNAVEFRCVQTRFHERGQVAWENYQQNGAAIPAEAVLLKLQAKLNAKRKKLAG